MPLFKKIWETVEGKTKVGKVLHEVLPFKKTRSVAGSIITGTKKASPLPEVKDLAVRETVTEADKQLSEISTTDSHVMKKVNEVRDILDDGKLNESHDDLSARTKKLITQASSALPLLAYLIYVIRTGNWSIDGFLQYAGMLLGL